MALLELNSERLKRSVISVGDPEPLRHFRRLVASGKPVLYGAIGGSITEGASASAAATCYVSRLGQAIGERTFCRKVNAGIGATGSRFGAFRCAGELLTPPPDLITVDFAVNDADTPDSAVSFEALIRRCRTLAPDALIVVLFMLKEDGTNVQHLQIPIGAHYNLAMLSYRDLVWPDLVEKTIGWRQISPDNIHPNDAGHELLCGMIRHFLFDLELPPKELPAPRSPDVADCDGTILTPETLRVSSNRDWVIASSERGRRRFTSATPGAELEFEFDGRNLVAGFRKYAGDFGRAELSVDGGVPVLLEGFFEMPPGGTWRGGHIALLPVAHHLEPGRHTATLRLLHERHPQSGGFQFDLEYLLNS